MDISNMPKTALQNQVELNIIQATKQKTLVIFICTPQTYILGDEFIVDTLIIT